MLFCEKEVWVLEWWNNLFKTKYLMNKRERIQAWHWEHGSVGKGNWSSAGGLRFILQNSPGEKREPIFISCSLTATGTKQHVCGHIHLSQTHYIQLVTLPLVRGKFWFDLKTEMHIRAIVKICGSNSHSDIILSSSHNSYIDYSKKLLLWPF